MTKNNSELTKIKFNIREHSTVFDLTEDIIKINELDCDFRIITTLVDDINGHDYIVEIRGDKTNVDKLMETRFKYVDRVNN